MAHFYPAANNGGTQPKFAPVTAWFASYYNDSSGRYEFQRGLKQFLETNAWNPEDSQHRTLPMLALWMPESKEQHTGAETLLPRAWQGDGPNPVAIVRESWDDPDGFYLAYKGGHGKIPHAHMDAGSFIFEDEGVRWAIDLERQVYRTLESKGLGIWDRRQHSDRWRVFRIGPYSHNVLLVDQRLQNVEGQGTIPHFKEMERSVHGIVELSDVYMEQVAQYQRHFTTYDNKVVKITDKLKDARPRTDQQGRQSATLRWRMMTRARVEIRGDQALLLQGGKRLYLKVLAPAEFTLRSEAVDPPPYYWDTLNPGVHALDLWCHARDNGSQEITILMSTDPEALEDVDTSLPSVVKRLIR